MPSSIDHTATADGLIEMISSEAAMILALVSPLS
jgi:hypothetical protein